MEMVSVDLEFVSVIGATVVGLLRKKLSPIAVASLTITFTMMSSPAAGAGFALISKTAGFPSKIPAADSVVGAMETLGLEPDAASLSLIRTFLGLAGGLYRPFIEAPTVMLIITLSLGPTLVAGSIVNVTVSLFLPSTIVTGTAVGAVTPELPVPVTVTEYSMSRSTCTLLGTPNVTSNGYPSVTPVVSAVVVTVTSWAPAYLTVTSPLLSPGV